MTSDLIYIRLHGPKKEAYKGAYPDETLQKYASKIQTWLPKHKQIYCYFDNDQKSYAVKDAQKLMSYLR
jgi:uncharacterized protein YecE (DUF72 family)